MIKKILEYNNVEVKLDSDLKISDLSLTINQGEFIFLIGKTGSGKSSILKSMYSENKIIKGEAKISDTNLSTIGEKEMNNLEPRERNVSMVFQNYALYPHMSVYDNMAYGLKIAKIPKKEIDDRVKKAANILKINDFLDRKPSQLSGGQRQRVAMGRAIVRSPVAFL
mgnify:CR=1 FL=1